MKRMSRSLFALLLCVPTMAHGIEVASFPPAGDVSDGYRIEVVIEGLNNPCGLALGPRLDKDTPKELFFAESGAGRVLRFNPSLPSETREVLTGLTVAKVPQFDADAGAWSLGFITPTKLAVVGGTERNRVSVYLLPAGDESLSADKQDHEVDLINVLGEPVDPILGTIAVGETAVYLTSGPPGEPGEVFRAGLTANRIEAPRPLMNVASGSELHWPSGLCLSPLGKMQFLVGSFAGELSEARDSQVLFLIPGNGKVALKLTPGLFDVVGLAYSSSGQLYAIDLAWENAPEGGVYRLDDARHEGKPACRAVKIAKVKRPTSLVFDAGGTMYVTAWGDGDNSRKGKIVKVTGEF
jgi:hypothetical protein